MPNEFARPLGLGILVVVAGFGTGATESWLPALVLSVVVASLFLDYWLSLIGLPCLALAGWISSQMVLSRGPVDETSVGLLTGVAILASATGLAAARLAGASLSNIPRQFDPTDQPRSPGAKHPIPIQTQGPDNLNPSRVSTSTPASCPVCNHGRGESLAFGAQFLDALRNEMRSEERARYLQAMQTVRVALHGLHGDEPGAPPPRSMAQFRAALALLDREPPELPVSIDRGRSAPPLLEQRRRVEIANPF